MTTVSWLLALHLTFTYAPKIIDAIQGIQQIEQNQKILHPKKVQRNHKII
jgi:hypothetical protein